MKKNLSSAAKFSVDKTIIQEIAIIGRSIRGIVVPYFRTIQGNRNWFEKSGGSKKQVSQV